jgi:hypothetical protein
VLKNAESQLQGLKPSSDDGAYGGVEAPPFHRNWIFQQPAKYFSDYSPRIS